jgi:hypothetical protein
LRDLIGGAGDIPSVLGVHDDSPGDGLFLFNGSIRVEVIEVVKT